MNNLLRLSLVLAAFVPAIDGAAFMGTIVTCLVDSDVCAGNSFFTTPSPGQTCDDPADPANCTTIYSGGWSWTYNFIEGFDNGTDLSLEDPDDVAAAETGLVVAITLDDDEVCEISVGNETCAECSVADCAEFNVIYDCTNIDMGGMSMECVALEPIFYPLSMSNETGMGEVGGSGGTGSESGGTESGGTGSGGTGSGGTGSGSVTSACPYVSSAKVVFAALVAGASFFAL
jgi:uncharacterized membrane protein YgcG